MGYFNQYPYEDNEELNLDYVLAKITAFNIFLFLESVFHFIILSLRLRISHQA